MSFPLRLALYFVVCGMINYLALQEQTEIGAVFFWPGNALGAFLAVRWRGRGRGKRARHVGFVLAFFVGHYIGSVMTPQPMTPAQQLWLVLVDTAYVPTYAWALHAAIARRRWCSLYRRSALLIAPVVLTVMAQGAVVALALTRVLPLGDPAFVAIDWISEQLASSLIVTMILAGSLTRGWGVRGRRLNRQAATLVGVLALLQIAMAFSNWLVIASIAIVPAIFAITRLGFAWSVFVTGHFMLCSTAAQIYFYVAVNDYRGSRTFYPEIFAHRVDLSMVAILAVFMGELLSQRKRLLDATRRRAEHDRLTGLRNRESVAAALRALRAPNRAGLALIDIDGFKQINDRHGHQAGDRVIVAVAHAIARVAGSTGLAARWGGEEFLVLFPDARGALFACLCEALVAEVAASAVPTREGAIGVTVSLGGVLVDDLGEASFEQACAQADARLYRAKREGKNRAVLDGDARA